MSETLKTDPIEARRAVLLVGATTEGDAVRRSAAAVSHYLTERGLEVQAINLSATRIASCNGSFDCWVKTPGVCRIRDANRQVAAEVIRSNFLILISRVRFGSFDAEVQGAMEHLIPLVSPFLRAVGGETHHAIRYDCYPSLGAIGIVDRDDEAGAIFRRRIERIALNLFSPAHAAAVTSACASDREVDLAAQNLLRGLGLGA